MSAPALASSALCNSISPKYQSPLSRALRLIFDGHPDA
jgi:hypothetical protein